ncbi:HflC protein [Alkaliphilus metalliredigens QYMF]|uniref:Protein HflC n=1 Tax=Alkaliphilus metalliredigens (strain QYMF) TaxID=293826 RepID=A6TSS5_ALKMQ|nr:protease modulator HflC [Alkaliphilus metalliredigens]ABR49243.1 HflC protein [Alkaliphilus metalliredigens QYMF]
MEPQEQRSTTEKIKELGSLGSRVAMIVVALVIIVGGFNLFTYTVSESELGILTQFTEVKKIIVSEKTPELVERTMENNQLGQVEIIEGKGLFFKLPWQRAETYTDKLLTFDSNAREVITRDKNKIILDNFAQWKIVNPALFKISVRTEGAAHTRLDDLLYSAINEEIGRATTDTVISDREYARQLSERVAESVNRSVAGLGIKVMDVRIKRTDLPEANSANIYNRMKTERERIARQFRSEGAEEALMITSEADMEATILNAEAYEEAQTIRGEGDAEAIRIYAEAHNKDPEFYEFYRTLQAYTKTIDGQTKMVIDSNSPFAKYLLNP